MRGSREAVWENTGRAERQEREGEKLPAAFHSVTKKTLGSDSKEIKVIVIRSRQRFLNNTT